MQFLHWLPEEVRQEQLSVLKGQKAVSFPAAYFPKTKGCKHWSWTNLSHIDNGIIIKTAPDFLIKNLIKTLEKYNQEFEVLEL